jgi:hypothetical protein
MSRHQIEKPLTKIQSNSFFRNIGFFSNFGKLSHVFIDNLC